MTPEAMDQLARAAQGGDRGAFRELVLALEGDLRLFLGAFEITDGLAEEVLQATFVSAYQNLGQYRGQGALRAWLKAIARNHLLRTLREQKRLCEMNDDALEGTLVDSGLEEIDRIEELEASTRKLRDCLQRLPAALRGLVEGRYVEDLASPELARRWGRTEIWVRVTLCRVRQSLRRCMEGQAS
jgi:RNA polymerase sigma-70 factor (ECF subfamily)